MQHRVQLICCQDEQVDLGRLDRDVPPMAVQPVDVPPALNHRMAQVTDAEAGKWNAPGCTPCGDVAHGVPVIRGRIAIGDDIAVGEPLTIWTA